MRLGSRSIRARITALLLLPLVSLAGLWIYTTVSSVAGVYGLVQADRWYTWLGAPALTLQRDLQSERLAAVRYDADPTSAARATYLAAQKDTDATAAEFRSHAASRTRLSGMDADSWERVDEVRKELAGLPNIRRTFLQYTGSYSWSGAYEAYTNLQEPFFELRAILTDDQSGEFSREWGNLIELDRAGEFLSRQQALVDGARLSGRLILGDYQSFLTTVDDQRLVFTVYVPELPPDVQQLYSTYLDTDDPYLTVDSFDNTLSSAGVDGLGSAVDGDTWDQASAAAVADLGRVSDQAISRVVAKSHAQATSVFRRDGVIAGLWLIVFAVSLWVSVRIGRGLVRQLVGLRDAAFDLANFRLPAVMRRLRDGENVNVAVEAPPLEVAESASTAVPGAGGTVRRPRRRRRDRDEIAQVGRAFNAVHRAAIGAAVDQAELRRGISSVFVHLARRSQALLNRQLTLLDEMERRVSDPSDLEDLFALDHLTTRMRRHADGLIILSGVGGGGRTQRRPATMTDLVRAAVGEVEDYTRVVIARMPALSVTGPAVSDLVHLLAELVENATVYSPPHTRVRVKGVQVPNGFVVEIDDRGLGMSEAAMVEANDRLLAGGAFDLADSDRMGLFVVSRLAQRHDVRVSLRGNAYGGTTAAVLLPLALLVGADGEPLGSAAAVSAPPAGGRADALGAGAAGATGAVGVTRADATAGPAPAGALRGGPARTDAPRAGIPASRPAAASRDTGANADADAAGAGAAGAAAAAGNGSAGETPTPSAPAASAPAPSASAAGSGGAPALPRRRTRSSAIAAASGSALPVRGGASRAGDAGPEPAEPASARAPERPESRESRRETIDRAGLSAAWHLGAPDDSGNPDGPGRPAAPPTPAAQVRGRHGAAPAEPEEAPKEQSAGRHRVGEDVPALPRRVRQASLAPQLRDSTRRAAPEHGGAGPGGSRGSAADQVSPGARGRSPEEVRATFGSFQRGLVRGRGSAAPTEGTPGAGPAGSHDGGERW